ncbi:MAG: aminotransferase class IV [bacterium]|nr:aminotransferase class IV [bacterium]
MPTLIRRLTPNGLEPVDYEADSLNDAARFEPDDGVYTVTNTFETTKVLKLNAHLDRMEDSARRADIPLVLDRPRLRAVLRQVILEAGYGDVRFRVTVSRQNPEAFILTVEPFKPLSPVLIEQGVRVITAPNSARSNPAAKTTDWMHQRQAIADRLTAGLYDAILLDENGFMLEGLSSNFYAIINGELRTAGAGVLPGIAQQIVFEIAPGILPLRRDAPHIDDLPQIEEAFITSSSRGIVPVVEIDDYTLGDGTPGAKTKALRTVYQAWVDDHLEEL